MNLFRLDFLCPFDVAFDGGIGEPVLGRLVRGLGKTLKGDHESAYLHIDHWSLA